MSRINKWTRIIVFCLALALLLSACTPAQTSQMKTTASKTEAKTVPSSQTAGKTQGAATSTAGTDKPETRFKISVAGPAAAPYDNNSDMVKWFTENTNIEWDMQYIEAAKAMDIMNLRFFSGEIPDIYSNLGYAKFYSLVSEGIGGTMAESLIRQEAPGLAAYLDELGQSAWDAAKHENGEVFTFPGVNAEYMYGNAMIWRKSWLDKFKAQPPKTLADAEKLFYHFAKDDPDGNGAADTYGLSEDGMQQVFYAYGANYQYLDENKRVQFPAISPKRKEALQLLAKWYADGVLDPEFITGENKGGYWALSHSFCSGRIGFTARGISNHWRLIEMLKTTSLPPFANQELFHQNFPNDSYVYGFPLEGPYGDKATGQRAYSFWSGFAKKFTSDIPRLSAFLRFMNKYNGFQDPKDYLYVGYGIEGVHWEYNDKGIPTRKEGYKTTDQGYKAGLISVFTFINNYKAVNLSYPEYANWRDSLYKEEGRSVTLEPFYYRNLPSAAKQTEIDKLQKEFEIDVITGRRKIDTFDAYKAQWLALGGQQLTDEANEIAKAKK